MRNAHGLRAAHKDENGSPCRPIFSTMLLILSVIIVCSPACGQEINGILDVEHVTGQSVVFVHGGQIDDYVSYLLLTTMDDVDLCAVVVTNTDTIADYAMQVQWKIMNLIGDTELPVGLSAARGWNPFPWLYRGNVIRQYEIEAFRDVEDNPDWPPYPSGDDLLRDLLAEAVEADAPVTLLVTCPLTPLSDLLKQHPELENGIERLIWMGGAINVGGNLDPKTIPAEVANPKAEWNAFWDPYALDWILQNTSIPIVLIPLDLTDQVPITENFLKGLEQQATSYGYSNLVYQSYALVSNVPLYDMWNSVTTTYVAHPEFFDEPETMDLAIETEGYEQGTIRQNPIGRQAEVVLNFAKKDAFYEYVSEQLRRSFVQSQR